MGRDPAKQGHCLNDIQASTISPHCTKSDLCWGAYQPGCGRTTASPKGQNGGRKAENSGKKQCKYGLITKVPDFVLERDFIKHTPYARRSEEDDIPFWAKMLLHLEYLLKDKDMLKHILAFMNCTKQFQEILGEAAFYHQNPGFDSTAGDHEILAGVLIRHITMVRLTSRVILKGLTKPNRPHIIQRLDNKDPEEVDVEGTRSVWEVRMEKKIQGTKVWVLIAHIPDGRWAGYFHYGARKVYFFPGDPSEYQTLP